MTCSGAFNISCDWLDPVGAFARTSFVQKGIQNYPLATRVALISLNASIGLIKPFLLPIISAIGLVVQPIIAIIRFCQHNDASSKKWWLAAGFSLITVLAVAGFMTLSAYKLTLLQGTYAVIGVCTISVALHVYRVSY